MVVIVNAYLSVDKTGLLHKISSLGRTKRAGQGLYRACTDVGKKKPGGQSSAFCTSGPVDMQGLVHSRAGFKDGFLATPGLRTPAAGKFSGKLGMQGPYGAVVNCHRLGIRSSARTDSATVACCSDRSRRRHPPFVFAKPSSSRSAPACLLVGNPCAPIFFQAFACRSPVFNKNRSRFAVPAKPVTRREHASCLWPGAGASRCFTHALLHLFN